jgi:hypothetical protein
MSWARTFRTARCPASSATSGLSAVTSCITWPAGSRTAPPRQTAFMNGTGQMIWDNIFGTWNGYRPREKAMLRAMLPIQRRFAALFSGEGWTPLVPTSHPGSFASLWHRDGIRLWTLVNRTEGEVVSDLPGIDVAPGKPCGISSGATRSPHFAHGSLRAVWMPARRPAGSPGVDFEAFWPGSALRMSRPAGLQRPWMKS